ncbi:MAG: hotdog fold thioesterase, partial [Chloroflexi bacterium]|nr:hotdog fold thioesterase [Chloroflexota bacterium]
ELSMSFLKPCPKGGTIRAVGYPLHDGRPLAVSQTWIEDGRGERVAHGTSVCLVLPQLEGFEHPGVVPTEPEAGYDTPDPWERPVMGEAIPWEVWRSLPGVEILARQIKGDLPQPPIHYLTGMTLREAEHGRVRFTMPSIAWLTSPNRTIQGGAIAMLAHAALTTAVTSTLEAGSAYRPVDVKVNFLRPVLADGNELVAHGSVLHRGRTLAVGLADVVNAEGKKVATATGSTIILSERPAG